MPMALVGPPPKLCRIRLVTVAATGIRRINALRLPHLGLAALTLIGSPLAAAERPVGVPELATLIPDACNHAVVGAVDPAKHVECVDSHP